MNQNEYKKTESSELKQDLWNEYMESLDENGEQKEEPSINISDRVKSDLDAFEESEKNRVYNRERVRRRRAPDNTRTFVAIFGAMFAAIGLTSLLIFNIADSRDYTEYDPAIEIDPPYEAIEENDPYMNISQSLADPQFIVGNSLYTLPVKTAEFLDSGEWHIVPDTFGEEISEVADRPVTVRLTNSYGESFEAMLVSPDGSTVPIEDSVVIGIGTTEDYIVNLPGSVCVGMDEYSLEYLFEEDNLEWTKTGRGNSGEYRVTSETQNDLGYDNYTLKIRTDNQMVTGITMVLDKGN